jgi:hypothetical protein
VELQIDGLLPTLQTPNQDPSDSKKVLGWALEPFNIGAAAIPALTENSLKSAALIQENLLGDGGAIWKGLTPLTTIFTDKPQEIQHTEVGPHPLSGGEMEQDADHAQQHMSPEAPNYDDHMSPEQENMHQRFKDEPAFQDFQNATSHPHSQHSAPDWASHDNSMHHGESEGFER